MSAVNLFLIFGLVVVAGFAALMYFFNRRLRELQQASNNTETQNLMLSMMNELRRDIQLNSGDSRKEIQERLDKITSEINRGMSSSSEALERQFKESRSLIKETAEKITRFEETNKQVANFASQLQSLENILRNPKHRGILGEYYLETMLKNVFQPSQYKMQFRFTNGDAVDAAIFYQDKILPIDSKFSMENYNRMVQEQDADRKKLLSKELVSDTKKRIDETSKYIRTGENTYDFAFMFIPSEGVYYDLLSACIGSIRETSIDLVEYAHRKKVIIVSPSSFYAYLQTILHGLRLVEVKESMTDIVKKVEQLDRHIRSYEVCFKKLGGNLTITVGSYNKSAKELAKIDKDVYRITDGKNGGTLELIEIEKPEVVN